MVLGVRVSLLSKQNFTTTYYIDRLPIIIECMSGAEQKNGLMLIASCVFDIS